MLASENVIKLKKHQDIRVNSGHPWVYSNEIENDPKLAKITPGGLVKVFSNHGKYIGTGYYNHHSLIALRILSRKEDEVIDEHFFIKKIKSAISLRSQFFGLNFYRLIHSEADGLPGLVIDQFDNLLVCQISTAGMELLTEVMLAALEKLFPNTTIVLRNDTPSRRFENLDNYVKVPLGEVASSNTLVENNLKFYFDPLAGQKTGWFYDQRENRQFIANLVSSFNGDCNVLDCYCYSGGFGINAKRAGASSVTFVDSSGDAISQVKSNLELNSLEQNCQYLPGEVFEKLTDLLANGKKYQLVILDPPAFVKSKKDFFVGLKGYEKLTKMASNLVVEGGYLFLASCSHNIALADLIRASASGISKAEKSAKLIRSFGAGIDHPLHPFLPESEYLKSLTYKFD